jgi:hypothetical protein
MKKFIAILTILIFSMGIADAATRVRGHYNRKSGTYISSHYRSKSDGRKYNNYSTRGNTNPYTGKHGSKRVY